jgi:hypothetical protein
MTYIAGYTVRQLGTGNALAWFVNKSDAESFADQRKFCVVSPDGAAFPMVSFPGEIKGIEIVMSGNPIAWFWEHVANLYVSSYVESHHGCEFSPQGIVFQ